MDVCGHVQLGALGDLVIIGLIMAMTVWKYVQRYIYGI